MYTTRKSNCEVTVVMPCLNEAETIGSCVRKAITTLNENNIQGEVIVADNGSTDKSVEIARCLGARICQISEHGYGSALAGGIAAAQGQYVVIGDADDSYDFSEIPRFVQKLREGAELVIGCRFPRGGGRIEPGAMPQLHRWLGTPVLTFLSRLLFGTKITDINCGMRGFQHAAYKRMNLRSTGMEFASEMVMKATFLGLKIQEVPVTLYPDGRNRPPHLRTWRDGWRHLRFMFLYSPRWLFFIPGLIFFILGGVGVAGLSMGSLSIGKIIFSLNTHIVCGMFTLLGFQIISFGLVAKNYALTHGLLPQAHELDHKARVMHLEYAVVIGIAVAFIGFCLLAWATMIWGEAGFGNLRPFEVPRVVIPSVTLIVLGVQIFFTGFMLGLLNLNNQLPQKTL